MNDKLATFRSYVASNSIECVYVWLAKAKDTHDVCYYTFDAEVYGPDPESSEHLESQGCETGLVQVNKTDGTGRVIAADDVVSQSIAQRILLELKDVWSNKEFPNSRFFTYCNINQ